MATTTKTYSSADWKLWTYRPQSGSFVLDFSQLDGTDVLGDGTDGLAYLGYQIAELNISSGGSPDYAVAHSMNPTTATITINRKDFTSVIMNDFLVGSEILLSLDSPSLFSNPYAYMFSGVIESANVLVIPGEDFSTITISARAFSSLQLNTDVGLEKDETTNKSTLIKNAASAIGVNVELENSAYNFKGTADESKSLGEWLTDLALCDFMQMRDTYYPVFVDTNAGISPSVWFVYWNKDLRFNITKTPGTSAGTFTENEITDVQLDWSGAGAPTGVTLTNYTDSAIVYQYGATTGDAGGAVSYSATVDVKDLTQMTSIGQQLLAMNKSFRPIQVSTITAVNNQDLVWKDTTLQSSDGTVTFYSSPNKFYDIGETITIDLPEFGVDEVDMIVTGREINVNPDNWTTNYTLWKGFTN
jgi:hypothetical protein